MTRPIGVPQSARLKPDGCWAWLCDGCPRSSHMKLARGLFPVPVVHRVRDPEAAARRPEGQYGWPRFRLVFVAMSKTLETEDP